MLPPIPRQLVQNCKPMNPGDNPYHLKAYPDHIKETLDKFVSQGAVVYVGPEYALVRPLDSDEIRFYTPQSKPGEWTRARQLLDGSVTML